MALGSSSHADTINSYTTRAARFADLRDHAVRMMKRRDRHGLHRCCDNQGKETAIDLIIVISRMNLPRKTS